jgi:DNA mismatch endonuclease (patch repair protein)
MVVRESTSRSMRSNRSVGTSVEVVFRKALWAAGIRGYRKNVRVLPGSPDLAFSKKRVAVFIHGCYWHRCARCQKDAAFKTNEGFWRAKLAANVLRDAASEQRLIDIDYRVVIVWECEVKKNLADSVERVKRALEPDTAQ